MPEIEGEDILTRDEKEEAKKEARQKKPLKLLAGQARLLTLKLTESPEEKLPPDSVHWTVGDELILQLEDVPDETEKPDEATGEHPADQLKKKVTGTTVGTSTVKATGVVNGKNFKVEKKFKVDVENVGEDIEMEDMPEMTPLKPRAGRAEGSGGTPPAGKPPGKPGEGGVTQGARSSKEV